MRARSFFRLCVGFSLGFIANADANTKTLERGWIGGEYKLATASRWSSSSEIVRAFPRSTISSQSAGIFVCNIASNTPAGSAGLRAGDLVLQANALPMTSLRKFRRTLDAQKPGDPLRLSIYREGELLDLTVTVGRETFRKEKLLTVGFMLSSDVDILPDPDFSLIALGFRRRDYRIELDSPEAQFAAREGKKSPAFKREGWEAWLGIASFAARKRILSQENVPPVAEIHASTWYTE